MDLNCIAIKGTLDDHKVMWSYLQDVVRSEFLNTKNIDKGKNQYSRGMVWSQDTKDFFATVKLTSGKRMIHNQRQNVGGPSLATVC